MAKWEDSAFLAKIPVGGIEKKRKEEVGFGSSNLNSRQDLLPILNFFDSEESKMTHKGSFKKDVSKFGVRWGLS